MNEELVNNEHTTIIHNAFKFLERKDLEIFQDNEDGLTISVPYLSSIEPFEVSAITHNLIRHKLLIVYKTEIENDFNNIVIGDNEIGSINFKFKNKANELRIKHKIIDEILRLTLEDYSNVPPKQKEDTKLVWDFLTLEKIEASPYVEDYKISLNYMTHVNTVLNIECNSLLLFKHLAKAKLLFMKWHNFTD